LVKKSKKGRKFYVCENNQSQKCDYISWNKPKTEAKKSRKERKLVGYYIYITIVLQKFYIYVTIDKNILTFAKKIIKYSHNVWDKEKCTKIL